MLKTLLSNERPVSALVGLSPRPVKGAFGWAHDLGLEELHFRYDSAVGLKAIIAIHNSQHGPALGGTRCISYATESEALADVVCLAQGMTYKSAFAQLPYGGGKAVLLRPEKIVDRKVYFETYGQFINSLNGRYVTSVDVGTCSRDMDIIRRKTPYVLGTSLDSGDPSKDTAKGVLKGLQAAVKVILDRDDFENLRIAVQGIGKVGFALAEMLHEQGARLAVSDLSPEVMQGFADKFGAELLDPGAILSSRCDILCPCALGGIINQETTNLIQAKIVCGSANNQLAEDCWGDLLFQRGVTYVPDYVVNAGGLIHIVYGSDAASCKRHIEGIYLSVMEILTRSQAENVPSHRLANRMAKQMIRDRTATPTVA